MKTIITRRNKSILKTIIVLLALWGILAKMYSPLILPGPIITLKDTYKLLLSSDFIVHVLITVKRLLIGLGLAIFIGSILGIVIGESKKIRDLFQPIFHLVQATPPISWLALAMIWFGLNGKATIFIVFIASLPILIINIMEGYQSIDKKLIEMAHIFTLNKKDILINITIPSLRSYFKSGVTIAVGLGWKLVIMGEVLSSNTGIGSQITNARLNIETGKVLAWTIIIVILGGVSQKIIDVLFSFNRRRQNLFKLVRKTR
ncbi:ABC transporter permease [Clostridiaceae bacterium M8S5]|nr:ABC transporter permease [Clostridiaceae bacterium M8S5]